MHKIAIIEDQKIDSDSMRAILTAAHPECSIDQFFNRKEAEKGLLSNKYDLVIVDIDLGGTPPDKYAGLAILGSLTGKSVVTLVVSGTPEENLEDVVLTLQAYDFLGKPFSHTSFLNVVNHALEWKPSNHSSLNELEFSTPLPAGLTWDKDRSPGFKWKGKAVRLSLAQLRLVICLVKNPGKVVETRKLTDLLDTGASNKAVAVHINGVRSKFTDVDPEFDQIHNDPGKGYIWRVEV